MALINLFFYHQGSEFFRGFRSVDQNGLGAAWDEVQRGGAPMPPMGPMYEPLQPTFEGLSLLLS